MLAFGQGLFDSHHLRKGGITGNTALEAREAIAGVAGIVDHVRSAFAFWKPQREQAIEILRILGDGNPEHPEFRVYKGGVVKSNDEADYNVRTYVRGRSGLLEDRTAEVGRDEGGIPKNLADLHEMAASVLDRIGARAEQGRPFTNSNYAPNGIYHKDNLARFRFGDKPMARKQVSEMVDYLAEEGRVRFIEHGGGANQIKPVAPQG